MLKCKKQIISWVLVIIWMFMLFHFSSQPAAISNNSSKSVTRVIIKIIDRVYPLDIGTSTTENWIDQFNHSVRKLGHFVGYFILALLVFNAFWQSGIRGIRLFIYSFLLCFAYAASDEIHQLFVPGRGGQVKDVLIDSAGAIVGIGMSGLLHKFYYTVI